MTYLEVWLLLSRCSYWERRCEAFEIRPWLTRCPTTHPKVYPEQTHCHRLHVYCRTLCCVTRARSTRRVSCSCDTECPGLCPRSVDDDACQGTRACNLLSESLKIRSSCPCLCTCSSARIIELNMAARHSTALSAPCTTYPTSLRASLRYFTTASCSLFSISSFCRIGLVSWEARSNALPLPPCPGGRHSVLKGRARKYICVDVVREDCAAQIDGIWHTGVVVGGKEYFFGQGIQQAPANATPFGQATETINMG